MSGAAEISPGRAAVTVNGEPAPETAGNALVRSEDIPGGHAACDAERDGYRDRLRATDRAYADAMRERDEARAERDAAYRERARLVAFLAACYPAVMLTDDAEPDWPIVFVDTPAGQMSWHIARADLGLFGHVPATSEPTWDGHTTEEKYGRLADLTEGLHRAWSPERCDPEPEPDPAERLLAFPLPPNDSGAATVRGYLTELLTVLWHQGESFSPLRPFGSPGWQGVIHAAMVREGLIGGAVDEQGRLEWAEDEPACGLVLAAIAKLGEVTP